MKPTGILIHLKGIIEFDRRYNISKKYDMTLPEAVLTFKILDNAGLTSKERQLALI